MNPNPVNRSLTRTAKSAAGLAALLLAAGCASAATTAPGSAAQPPPPAAASGPAALAARDAAALRAALRLPGGSVPAPGAPDGTPAVMTGSAGGPVGSERVVLTDWWIAPGGRAAVSAWMRAHNSTSDPADGVGTGTGPDGASTDYSYFEPATAVLAERYVDIRVGALPGGRSVVRLDVVEIYRPAKPAGDTVPATAYLAATLSPGGNPPGAPRTVAVTDRAVIAKIAALVNALPTAAQGGVYSCPAAQGGDLALAFGASASSAPLARVDILLSGCQGVTVTLGHTAEPGLDDTGGTPPYFPDAVAALLGLRLDSAPGPGSPGMQR
jgi:hypothetical protein